MGLDREVRNLARRAREGDAESAARLADIAEVVLSGRPWIVKNSRREPGERIPTSEIHVCRTKEGAEEIASGLAVAYSSLGPPLGGDPDYGGAARIKILHEAGRHAEAVSAWAASQGAFFRGERIVKIDVFDGEWAD